MQRAELAVARAEPKRYDAKDWDLPLEYRAVDGEHDVFGDGSVVLLPTPGHTAGHQSLWIRARARRAIRADRGCLLHARASREDDSAHERLRRGADDGVHERLRSLRDRQGVTLLYGHDAEQWNALPRGRTPLI